LDTSDDPLLFERPAKDEREYYNLLELEMESVLKKLGVEKVTVQTRKFEPVDLPSVLITTAETEAERKLRFLMNEADLLGFDEIAVEAYKSGRKRPIFLSLNANNPMIQYLAKSDSYKTINKESRELIIMGLYNSTLLYSPEMLETQKAAEIHKYFIKLLQTIAFINAKPE